MTILREPVSRTASLFHYMSSASSHVLECLTALNQGRISYFNITSPAKSTDPRLEEMCSEPMIRRQVISNETVENHLHYVNSEFMWALRDHSKRHPFILGPTCLPPKTSFPQFIQTLKVTGYDNFMTRMLTGTTTRSFLRGWDIQLSPSETLSLAKQMLRAFPFVGLQERFEDSVELFLWTFGFPYSGLESEFVFNKSAKQSSTLRPEDEDLARRMDYLDLELYEFGVQLFEKRFQRMRLDKLAKQG